MKNILKVISWAAFYIMALAAGLAIICTFGGVIAFIMVVFGAMSAITLQSWAVGYFASVTIVIFICSIYTIYELFSKVTKKI